MPLGRPLANTTAYVLDEHLTPLPAGVAGELYIGGAGVAIGYWNRPDLTRERFLPDPFDGRGSERLYRTGDVAFYLPDGNLVFAGRVDRQVKIRGFRVELDEIETVLAGHREVKQCAVVLNGEGERPMVAAFVALHDGGAGPPQLLRSYLAQRLPEYMVPAAFVCLPDLPLTLNGKIDRRALPLWKLERLRPEEEFQAPSTATEQRLAEVWREVLSVWPIGATDNFFELGADSLQATQLLALIEERFRIALPSAVLWRFPTLERMATALDSREFLADLDEEVGEVAPLQPRGSRIPFFCFPGNDGAAFFLPLSVSLGEQQPFYAVRDPQPYAERGEYTVEEAAHRMVDAIRKVQPSGPYVLGGHCFGGLLAFEAARRLTELGETAPTVILVDVGAPGYPKVARHWRKYVRVASSVLRGERALMWAECRQHAGVLAQLLRKRMGAAAVNRQPAPAAAPVAAAPPVHPNVLAGRKYDPQPFACHLVNIIATGERHSTEILDDPRLGWKDLALGSFASVEVPGRAEALYRQPGVRELAARIGEILDGINAQVASPEATTVSGV